MYQSGIRYFDVNCGGKTNVDYLEELIKSEEVVSISAVIYSSGKKMLQKLMDVIPEKLLVNFYISGYLKRMQEETFNFLCSFPNIKISVINTHCKFLFCRTKNNYYIINSSSNLNSNSKIEIIEINNDKKRV